MDETFESRLLEMIDGFLDSDGDYDDFLRFKGVFADLYAARTNDAISEIMRSVPEDVPPHLLPTELYVRADLQLPRARRAFFEEVAERSSYTIDGEPTSEDRRYGYGSLTTFKRHLRVGREQYRTRFGV